MVVDLLFLKCFQKWPQGLSTKLCNYVNIYFLIFLKQKKLFSAFSGAGLPAKTKQETKILKKADDLRENYFQNETIKT